MDLPPMWSDSRAVEYDVDLGPAFSLDTESTTSWIAFFFLETEKQQ